VMTGPSLVGMGGISAFARVLKEHATRCRGDFDLQYVPMTALHAAKLPAKICIAIRGYAAFWKMIRPSSAIVHVNTASGADFWRNLPLLLAAVLMKRKTILHVHPPWSFQLFLKRGPRLLAILKCRAVGLADLVVVPTEGAVAVMSEVIPSSRVRVVPNGVASLSTPSLPLSERAQLVTFLGWLVEEKGIYDLLRAMAVLRHRGLGIELAAFGPYGAAPVREAASDLGISEYVTADEWVFGGAKDELLARSRIVALPSYTEGLPVVLLEAMQAGTPIVATNVGGIPDVVQDGVNGFLVAPGDVTALANRLERLLTDASLWNKTHTACVDQAPMYRIGNVADVLARVYQEVSPCV